MPPSDSVVKLAEVIPFHGLRYNNEMIPDLARVVSPPYDIISPEGQERLHRKHPNNAVYLDYSVALPGDDEDNNRYTRAAATLDEWIEKRVLIPETRPAFYVCREEYRLPGKTAAVRTGLIGAVSLHDFSEGIVLPHEMTHSGPKEDRLKLMRETEANLSAVYSLYPDAGHSVRDLLVAAMASSPVESLTDEAGTEVQMWVIDDPGATAALSAALAEQSLYIADGHHRYETALAYREERRAAGDQSGPFDYMMMYLSSMDDDNQPILPVHRFITSLGEDTLTHLHELLSEDFEIETVTAEPGQEAEAMLSRMREAGSERNAFGMVVAGAGSFNVLTASKTRPIISETENGHSASWRSLDLAVLNQVILSGLLDIRPGGANAGARVRYIERTEPALAELKKGGFDIAFFINPTRMEEVRMVAEAGEKMPQKSTYFYPKPLTGLVFRSFKY